MDFDIAFVDFDGEGCLPGLGVLLAIALVVGVSQVLMAHWIFAIALACLMMTAVFGIAANRKGKQHKPNGLQELGAVVCIIGFLGFSAYGIYDYRHQQHMIEVHEQIEAQHQIELEVQEMERRAKVREENAKIGALGRFKRWALGTGETSPVTSKTGD